MCLHRNTTSHVQHSHFLILLLQVVGPVSQMTEANVIELGCITQGFSDADLEMLPFTSEALEDIARCGWNESQVM